MSNHDKFVGTFSTSDSGAAAQVISSISATEETTQQTFSGQNSPYELSSQQRAQSLPANSHILRQTSDPSFKVRKFPFKIDLSQGNQENILASHATADLEPLSRAELAGQAVAIARTTPKLPSDLSLHLGIWTRPQSPPPEDSLSETSPTLSAPLSHSASMASRDSNNDVEDTDAGEDEQPEETENVKLDLDGIANSIVDLLAHTQLNTATLSIVHQPLPFQLPLRLSAVNPTTMNLFTRILNRVRHDSRVKASHITIQHVLSTSTLPEVIPSSPPVTPSSLIRNSDQHGYFAVKTIFTSVSTSTGVALPPGDAHLCITERLIPPSGEFETSGFLSESTDSGFMIRLSELAKGGVFVLALPTSHGGQTFHKNVLSKILNPVLRSIIFRLGLHSEMAREISNLAALKQLLSFNDMQTKIQSILSAANAASFPGTARPSFELVSATKGTIPMPFEVWYPWWYGQERARIMQLLNYHLNVRGQGLTSSSTQESFTRSSIMIELEDQMKQAGAQQTVVPDIEIAVFTVQRTDA